jgi:hypothetical protein
VTNVAGRFARVDWMRRVVIIGTLALSAATCGWFDSPVPDEARVVVEGESGKTVRVITSTKFFAAVNDAGQTRVVITSSDTTVATLPFTTTVRVEEDERFFVETARLDTDLQTVRMQVYFDGRKEFDEGGALTAGKPYRFVYTFNQAITREILVI